MKSVTILLFFATAYALLTPQYVQYMGLPNLGNSCYLNAILQSLAHVEPFRHVMTDTLPCRQANCIAAPISQLLTTHTGFNEFPNLKYSAVSDHLRRICFLLDVSPWHQEDAHEVLLMLFQQLDEELKGALSSIFAGSLKICTYRGNDTPCVYQSEKLVDISVPVLHSEGTLLEALKQSLISAEILSNDGGAVIERRQTVSRWPDVLIIHLKRFAFDRSLQRVIKLDNRLSFPKDFFVSREDPVDFSESEPSQPDYCYELSSVVLHQGTPDRGHYLCIGRTGPDQWRLYDDHVTTDIDWTHVEKLGFQGNPSAYLLIYTRKSPSQ